mgnify:CR=1 FL=1
MAQMTPPDYLTLPVQMQSLITVLKEKMFIFQTYQMMKYLKDSTSDGIVFK